MEPKTLGTLMLGGAVLLALLVSGLAAGLFFVSSDAPGVGTGGPAKPPALTSFDSSPARCTDRFMVDSSTAVSSDGGTVRIVEERNVSLPDSSYRVGQPTLERLNDTTYALRIPTVKSENSVRDCTAYARYNASIRLPASEEGWTVLVYHDGELATRLFGTAHSSGAGASVSAGARVGESPAQEPENTTATTTG